MENEFAAKINALELNDNSKSGLLQFYQFIFDPKNLFINLKQLGKTVNPLERGKIYTDLEDSSMLEVMSELYRGGYCESLTENTKNTVFANNLTHLIEASLRYNLRHNYLYSVYDVAMMISHAVFSRYSKLLIHLQHLAFYQLLPNKTDVSRPESLGKIREGQMELCQGLLWNQDDERVTVTQFQSHILQSYFAACYLLSCFLQEVFAKQEKIEEMIGLTQVPLFSEHQFALNNKVSDFIFEQKDSADFQLVFELMFGMGRSIYQDEMREQFLNAFKIALGISKQNTEDRSSGFFSEKQRAKEVTQVAESSLSSTL